MLYGTPHVPWASSWRRYFMNLHHRTHCFRPRSSTWFRNVAAPQRTWSSPCRDIFPICQRRGWFWRKFSTCVPLRKYTKLQTLRHRLTAAGNVRLTRWGVGDIVGRFRMTENTGRQRQPRYTSDIDLHGVIAGAVITDPDRTRPRPPAPARPPHTHRGRSPAGPARRLDGSRPAAGAPRNQPLGRWCGPHNLLWSRAADLLGAASDQLDDQLGGFRSGDAERQLPASGFVRC